MAEQYYRIDKANSYRWGIQPVMWKQEGDTGIKTIRIGTRMRQRTIQSGDWKIS